MLGGLGSKQIRMTNFAISGEGIADDKVVGIVADQTLTDPHLCLFRIETLSSRSMGTLSRSDTKLENKANKASFEKSQGAPLKFGMQVQLRHVHSGRFLSLNLMTSSSTPGAWSVSVSMPSELMSRKITLLPFTRSHNIGDSIKCDEAASLVFQTENLRYYLQAGPTENEFLEIHSTHKPASWKFIRYENYNESIEAIKFGTPIKIRYSKMAVHMALKREKISQSKSFSALVNLARTSTGSSGEPTTPRGPLREIIVTKGEVEDYSDFWILQNVNVMKGGCAKWNSKFYIKNALTGEFIVPNPQDPGVDKPKIMLRSKPDPSFYFTFPKPNSFHEESLIPYEYPLLIKSSDGSVLTLDQKKTNEEALDHLVPAKCQELYLDSGEIRVDLEPLWADKKESLFDVTVVEDSTTKFFNFIKSLTPKFLHIKTILEEFSVKKEESGRKIWEAAEFVEKRLEMMLAALKFLLSLLRESSGHELTTKQRILTGLRFHAILIDIAAVLHVTFDPESPQTYAIELLSALAKENIVLIWDLLRDSVLENSSSARLMAENQIKLCELLKYDTRRIGMLLTEIFRLVDPEIKDPKSFYHEWCSRLETLTKRNLTEQIIYLKIIRNLCEIDDVGVLEYQREVTWHLFSSEISFEIISLSFLMGEIAIKFGKKGEAMGMAEFNNLNPDLASLFKLDLEGNSVILIKDLSGLPDYVEYIQAALMLYHCICRGKGVFACELAASRLGLTLPAVYIVSQDLTVHIDIRQACLFLLEAFCITAPPYEPYTETDTSFNYAELKLNESRSLHTIIRLLRFDPEAPFISKILRFVFEFWMKKDLPKCIIAAKLHGPLNYLKAMLRITLAVVEYQHCGELYSLCILKAMLFLLAGFTDAANMFRGKHWSTDLISKAVKEGQKERKVELLVNELLASVLTTILAIKKIGRRSLLSHVVQFLISKPSVFRATLLGVGILPSNSLAEVTIGLKELLDDNRPNKLIIDFLKHAEKERGKQNTDWDRAEGTNTYYIPDFDFRDLVNSPDLKEAFIRVILEWFSFSPFLKEKMIEVMGEVFKENKLFERSLKYVDIYSLGPVSEMYNRLRWIKENSEFDSLLIRAKFESSLAGKSTSITRISSILEYIINFIHPLACSSVFILTKTQNIVRHLELHKDLFGLWGLIQYLDKIGKGNDSPSIRLKSGFSSFLYYFVRNNPKNAKEIEKLLRPQHYVLTVFQYPAFLRLINDFNHISLTDLTRLIVYVLDEARQNDRSLCMLSLLEYVMVDNQGAKKQTIQNVVSTIISERVDEALKMFQDRPSYEARLIRYLSLSAEDNPAVIAQCRFLIPLSKLIELMQREESTEMLGACLYFLYAVYVKKTDDVKTLKRIEDVKEILQRVMKVAKANMRDPRELIHLVADGAYPLVYFTRTPGYNEIHMNSPSDIERLSRWTFLYNEWDGHGYGVLRFIPEILSSIQLDYTIQRSLIEFYYALAQCLSKLKQISERLSEMVTLKLILNVFEKCEETVMESLKILNSGDVTPGLHESLCEIPDQDVQQLRTILSNSFQFPLITRAESEIEVDEHMGRIIKAGYQHYKKQFYTEDEGDYISQIANLIDPRLTGDGLVTKKEIKEAIPALLRKIKRLQRLFSSPKQRTFFFRILEGIVPDEERINLKILLNPLFEQAELANSALMAIMRMDNIDEVNAALAFLRKLFLMQSREFMDTFRESLDEGSLAYPLFIQIQKELDNMKSSILSKAMSHKQKASLSMNLSLLSRFVVAARSDVHEVPTEVTKHHQMVVNMLLFMQICCDNCNEPFQVFYRTQLNKEGKADVDMVSALAGFLVDVRVVKDFLISNKAVFQVLDAALSVLVDFVTGPCASNQMFLGNNVHIYLVMNMLINMCQGKEDPELLAIHNKSIAFLTSLLEGNPDSSIPETMSKFLDLALLRIGCETIYDTKVVGFENQLSLQSDELSEMHKGVVDTALKQAIMLIKLKHIGILHDELIKFEGTMMEPTPTFEYFSKYIGYVEIDREGQLEAHFFPIPWKCKYITPTTRLALVAEVNRSSHQEKIEDFISRLLLCRREMEHQQYLYRFGTFKKLSGRWQLFGKISYYLALLINIVLVISIGEPNFKDFKGSAWAFTSVAILGVLQITAYMACFFFNLIEYYPQTVMSSIKKPIELEMHEFPAIEDSDCQSMHRVHSLLLNRQKLTYSEELKDKLKEVLLNFDMYYTYTYFMISITAVYEPVFYPFLLLDMIKQTPELANVLKSVTQNWRQLILTMWLGVIIIYLFAIFAFVYYSEHFSDEVASCDDLMNCFFSTLNVGIRSGGGVGDGMNSPENTDYWSRMVFDMLFFMINIIILLNIVFGIIIDTFAELRDERMFILEDIRSKCYICGQDRSIIEMKGSGWSYHFMCEHSAFAYLSFLTFIAQKKIYDCNGLEKLVKEKMDKMDTSFMPTTSIAMQRRDASNEEVKEDD